MAVKVACPNPACDASYSVAIEDLRGDARCKRCGTRFDLGEDAADGPNTAAMDTGPIPEPPLPREFGIPNPFGRYRIEKRLGQGGMGAVFLAQDTELDRKVALKVPGFGAGDPPAILERFQREARAAARLHHPNLCPVYDVGQVGGVQFLTMAFIEGTTLARALTERGGPMGEEDAARLARTLALAIGEAHRIGIVHRDLKPANVMITARGAPVVLDFGLARRAEDERMTAPGTSLGTPAYMPPEQVRSDPAAIGPASDIYALGVILYEMLTGRLPFEGPATAVMAAVLTESPPPPSAHRPGLDRELEQVVCRAMARRPGDRFSSMDDFAAALGAYLSRVEGPPTVEARRPDPPRPPSGRWAALAAGGAGLVLLLGVVIWIVTDRGKVRIQVNDPASVKVLSIDGRTIELDVLGEPLSLRAGAHDLEVRRRDLEVQTRHFTVGRGRDEEVIVDYTPKADPPSPAPETAAVAEGEPPASSPPAASREAEIAPSVESIAFGGQRPGDVKRLAVGPAEVALCWCPPGRFTMGSPPGEEGRDDDEGPVEVEISRGFWMMQTEMTQDLYEAITGKPNPSRFAGPRRPVERVSYDDAVECAAILAKRLQEAGHLPAGWTIRLPTEAQWEYACRAGPGGSAIYGYGDDPARMRDYAWYIENSEFQTHPVAQKLANGWGLYDMAGNVWEWCLDGCDMRLPGGRDPFVAPRGAKFRVHRGGSWGYMPSDCRPANRGWTFPAIRNEYLGFRLVAVQAG